MVNRQRGPCCTGSGDKRRSIALAEAILVACGWEGIFREFAESDQARLLRLLEINKAGTLSPTLRRLPNDVVSANPALDMQARSYADASFDLIVHPATMEHVPDPIQARRESTSVLTPAGALCFATRHCCPATGVGGNSGQPSICGMAA